MTNLIYENYKEPLKAIPKSEGFGYYGTLATTADKRLVQCHICGELRSKDAVRAKKRRERIKLKTKEVIWQEH